MITFDQALRLAPGTRLIYHRLTTASSGMVVREPVTVYFAGYGDKRMSIIWPGVGQRAVDPRWLELPAGEQVVDERVIKAFGKKRGQTK
jgi:hypothetical protein